jgi:hypothetical protein
LQKIGQQETIREAAYSEPEGEWFTKIWISYIRSLGRCAQRQTGTLVVDSILYKNRKDVEEDRKKITPPIMLKAKNL